MKAVLHPHQHQEHTKALLQSIQHLTWLKEAAWVSSHSQCKRGLNTPSIKAHASRDSPDALTLGVTATPIACLTCERITHRRHLTPFREEKVVEGLALYPLLLRWTVFPSPTIAGRCYALLLRMRCRTDCRLRRRVACRIGRMAPHTTLGLVG